MTQNFPLSGNLRTRGSYRTSWSGGRIMALQSSDRGIESQVNPIILRGSNDLSLHEVELSGNCLQLQMPANRDQLLSWQSTVHFNGFSASGQFDGAELIRYMITKPQRRQPDQTHLKLLQMSGDVHLNPGPATKYPCPLCIRNVTSRGVSYKCTKCYGWVRARKMLWNLKCSSVSEERSRRIADLHSQIDNLLQTAIVTRVYPIPTWKNFQ